MDSKGRRQPWNNAATLVTLVFGVNILSQVDVTDEVATTSSKRKKEQHEYQGQRRLRCSMAECIFLKDS